MRRRVGGNISGPVKPSKAAGEFCAAFRQISIRIISLEIETVFSWCGKTDVCCASLYWQYMETQTYMVPAGALSGQRCFRAAFRALFLCFYSKKQTGFYLNVTKKKMSKWCVSCKRRSSETQHHNPQTRKHLRFNIPAFWFPNMMTGNPARIKDNVFSELQQPQWNTSSVIHFLLCSAVSAEYAELSASVGKRPHCWGLELVAEIKQDVLLLVPWWN